MNEPGRGELAILRAIEFEGGADDDVLLEVVQMLRRLRLLRAEQKAATVGGSYSAEGQARLRTEVDFWLYRIETAGWEPDRKDEYLDAMEEA